MILNISPLISHLHSCFTTIIFYSTLIDIYPPPVPLSIVQSTFIQTQLTVYCTNQVDTKTVENGNSTIHHVYLHSQCGKLLKKSKIKGTRCVGILTVFPTHDFGSEELHSYANLYWTHFLFDTTGVREHAQGAILEDSMRNKFYPIFFYSNLKFISFTSNKNFEVVQEPGSYYRRDSPFLKFPVLIAYSPTLETKLNITLYLFFQGLKLQVLNTICSTKFGKQTYFI